MGTAVSDQVSTEEAARAIRNLADLYERYAPWLARRLRRAGATCVEDLVQETYLRIATYSTLGRSVAYPKAMLLTVATNLSKDWAKKRYKRQISEARRDSSCVNGHHVADAEHSILIKQIILGLPEPLRDVFVMSRVGGLSNAQIAERLGISPKTVEWRMTKALAHCAAQLR